jgi:hypothetical protein
VDVPDGCQQGGGDHRSDPGYALQALRTLICPCNLIDLYVIVGNTRIKMSEFLIQSEQFFSEQVRQAVFGLFQDLGQALEQVRPACRDLYAVLQQQSPDLVDLRRALSYGQATHPMDSLNILLPDLLDGNKAHIGALGCFTDRLRIRRVMLVGFHVGLDELRRNQFHLMTVRLQ